MSHPSRAMIIGAGIAGPALALFLHKAGCAVDVYEAYPQFGGAGGALTLAPNGMHVLRELGLADRIEATGNVITRFEFRSHRGRRLGAIPYGTIAHPKDAAVSISRQSLQFILLEALWDAGITVQYNKRLDRIEQDAQEATAFFEDGTRSTADVLIGADGIWSRVRKHILPDAPEPGFTGLVGFGGFAPMTLSTAGHAIDPQSMVLCFGNGPFLGYGLCNRSGADRAGWWSALPSIEPLGTAALRALETTENRRRLLEAGAGWFGPIPSLLETTQRSLAVNLFDMPSLPCWSRGRVTLIGDAAHAVSPHSGQGASMALEDAIVLAGLLRQCDGAPHHVFARFEAGRRERVERVIALGRRSGDSKRKGRFGSWLQLMLMPLFLRLGRHSMDWIHDYRPRWETARAAPVERPPRSRADDRHDVAA